MDKQREYKDIELFKRECDDNYLLLLNNKTLSVGFLVKDTLLLLQSGITNPTEIKEELYIIHKLEIEIIDIENIIRLINKFTFESTEPFYVKLFKLFDPSSIHVGINFLFNKVVFYYSFVLLLILNLFLILIVSPEKLKSANEWIIWSLSLGIILLFHEFGHSLSAKKYGINCKEIGIGLYLIFPILYTNLGESWKLTKEKRIMINLSGIYFQLIIGTFIGFSALLISSSILSKLFFANIAIVIANINPLIKLDGYWIFADLLNVGNLSKAANKELRKPISSDFFKNMNTKLFVYALLRAVFTIAMLATMITMLITAFIKIINQSHLSYNDYLIIVFIICYAKKYIKIWICKMKKNYF